MGQRGDVMTVIGLFGATGVTGLLLTEYALQEGHTVYALARTPSKLQLPGVEASKLDNLHIVQGDIGNQDAVDSVVSKADVVIETLGAQLNRPTRVKQDGASAIIAAMKKHHKTRFVAVTSVVCDKDHSSPPSWVVNLLMGHIKGDLQAMEAVILTEAGWLDYTIIRPPHLVPVAPTKQCTLSAEAWPPGTDQVPFADLALAMLDSAKSGRYSRQVVGINTSVPVKVGWKEMEKARVILWDSFYARLLVPGAKLGVVLAAVLLARWAVMQQAKGA